jgi:lipopolysaccharide heptosyltransferase I
LALPPITANTAASAVTIGRGQSYTYLFFCAMVRNSFLYETEPSSYDITMVGPDAKILLIKPSSLGDIVMALPALSALRRSFPRAKISWLIRPEFAALIEGHPHLDEIILFDRKFLAKAWHSANAGRSLLSLIRTLNHGRFDAVLDLQGLFRTGLLAWCTRCPQRFGPRWREMAHLFYTTSIPPRMEWVHVVDYYLKLVEAMGASDLRAEFILPENPIAAGAVHVLLSQHRIPGDRYVVVIPGSAQTSKCWPVERFAALADRLASQHGLAVVATGSKSEHAMIERIRSLAQYPPANLASETPLPELVEVLRRAKLVVSNDTGPGHIAAALGRPLVMMFSWSNPLRVGPYGRPQCVVARDISSRGLANRSRDPQHSIQHVTFDEVYAKVVEQLQASDRRL